MYLRNKMVYLESELQKGFSGIRLLSGIPFRNDFEWTVKISSAPFGKRIIEDV